MKRKRGGQPKPKWARKRRNVTIRMRDALYKRLKHAAKADDRSLSEEIAKRLDLSLNMRLKLDMIEMKLNEFDRRASELLKSWEDEQRPARNDVLQTVAATVSAGPHKS